MGLSRVKLVNTMKTIESLTYQKILAFLSIKHKNDAIESMVHCIAEVFGFQSTFFLPISSDNRYLSYVTLDHGSTSFNEIMFALDNFKHPFSQVVYERKAKEIEVQDLWGWQSQSQQFKQIITAENLDNGLIIMPLFHEDEYVQGCIVMSLIDYRKSDFNKELFKFYLDIVVQHLKNIEDFRLKEDEGFYLTRSIARSEKTYLDYIKKLELLESIIAHTPEMESLVSKMAQIVNSNVSVLFSGSTGTGKTYLAQKLNEHSSRKKEAFIIIDCEAMPELCEKDFFKPTGFLAQSRNGTLLLENISFLPEELQASLASVFLNGYYLEFESNIRYEYRGRVIATTKEYYSDLLKRRFLRPDFFAQISQIIFLLPDLKERKSDFRFFIDKYITQFNAKTPSYKKIIGYNDQFLKEVLSFDWEDNLHGLETYLETKFNQSRDGILKACERVHGKRSKSKSNILIENFIQELLEDKSLTLNGTLTQIESAILKKKLEQNEGKRQLVADKLNLPLRTLAYKCQKYGL